ncbi:MAG: CPBP family intramembrane metalloprotease [Ruminococcaceae bacterium]|nr:CPBP family intramembrane metalloprotease [Oscillospiraceae bacterium]
MDYNQNNNQYQNFNQQQNFNQYPYYNQAPQGQFNPYLQQNNPQAYYISQQKFLKLREQKNEIRRFAKIFAFAMLGFLVASMLFSAILEAFGLIDLYYSNGTFSSSVGIFYSLLTVGVPFFIAKKFVYKTPDLPVCSYSAPRANLKTVSIILLSVLGCLASMYVTGYIQMFFEGFGFSFSSGDEPQVNSVVDLIALFIGTAIIPPLVEEFAMRNVVMQPLRKYGNLFAIICSALVFGVFHGTPSQIPFAILCGLFLGYAVIATDSIWTGVIIHAIVNGLSCCYYTFLYFTDEETADTAYGFVCLVLAGLGFAALLIYISKYKDEFNRIISKNGLEEYTLKQKISKFIFAPAMIIAIIVFLIQAFSMISFGSEVTM